MSSKKDESSRASTLLPKINGGGGDIVKVLGGLPLEEDPALHNGAAGGLHNGASGGSVLTLPDKCETFLIGVAGGTASGKSTVCQKIVEALGQLNVDDGLRRVDIISQESFYRDLDDREQSLAEKGMFDFDHPTAFDEKLMIQTINDLTAGKSVIIPQYDYVKNRRDYSNSKTINPANVILFEGILVFYFQKVRNAFNMKLFVDTDADTRLSRRVVRDMRERNRQLENILNQYVNFVKPAFEEFCLPTKKYADIIIPRGADNIVAIDLIVQHIQDILKPARNHDFSSRLNILSNNSSTTTVSPASNSATNRPH